VPVQKTAEKNNQPVYLELLMSSEHLPQAPVYVLSAATQKKKVGIVVAGWHKEITETLKDSARETILKAGIAPENIIVQEVPGSFELTLGAQYLIEYMQADAVVVIGCLVKGETPHFHYISEAVTLSLSQLQSRANRPIGYGLLTVDTIKQAKERAGGKQGNKGEEAAHAALFMLSLKEDIKSKNTKASIGFGSV
jgi:6,7-dimethyl-8-ribityllumazine synthase